MPTRASCRSRSTRRPQSLSSPTIRSWGKEWDLRQVRAPRGLEHDAPARARRSSPSWTRASTRPSQTCAAACCAAGTSTTTMRGHETTTATERPSPVSAAAAGNDRVGIAGMCWRCRIMPVKVLNANGSGSHSNIAAGIIWAADHGADVINLSLAGRPAPASWPTRSHTPDARAWSSLPPPATKAAGASSTRRPTRRDQRRRHERLGRPVQLVEPWLVDQALGSWLRLHDKARSVMELVVRHVVRGARRRRHGRARPQHAAEHVPNAARVGHPRLGLQRAQGEPWSPRCGTRHAHRPGAAQLAA